MKGVFFAFTNNFKYFGRYISYSLQENYDIDARIAAVSALMLSLSKFYTNTSVKKFSKYLIFFAIPTNLPLGGGERWALFTSFQKNLEFFYIV